MEIGIDIEDVSRFINKSKSFYQKIFTQNEIEYCLAQANPHENFCARFCAKEAVIKAITNISDKKISYKDVEILKRKNNSPYINILDDELSKYNFLVSISHEREKAIAFVIVN